MRLNIFRAGLEGPSIHIQHPVPALLLLQIEVGTSTLHVEVGSRVSCWRFRISISSTSLSLVLVHISSISTLPVVCLPLKVLPPTEPLNPFPLIHAAYSFQHLLRSLPTLRRLPPPPTLRPLPPLPQAPAFQQHCQRLGHIRSNRLFRRRPVSDLLCLRPHRSHHSPAVPLASRPQQIHPQPASTLAGPAR